MKSAAIALMALLMLTACGVDGAPTRPEPKRAETTKGVRMTGQSYFGYDSKRGVIQGHDIGFHLSL